MSEPKPLFGADSAIKTAAPTPIGPKPLAFPTNTPVKLTPTQTEVAKSLDFSYVSPAPAHTTPNPGALFNNPKANGIVDLAIKSAQEKFSNLGTALESVERQIRQLVPLTISLAVTWGDAGVSQGSELITKSASFIKMFSELRGNELCEAALNASAQVNTGFFQRLAGNHNSVLGYKPNLLNLKTQLSVLLPQCDELLDKVQTSHSKVAINAAALSSVCEAVGDIQDSSLAVAVDNRRRILAQCAMQSDLTVQQLKQSKTLIVEQLSRASQLLDVTIPAFESAHATK